MNTDIEILEVNLPELAAAIVKLEEMSKQKITTDMYPKLFINLKTVAELLRILTDKKNNGKRFQLKQIIDMKPLGGHHDK